MASYQCEKCGRVFELPDDATSGVCPACATPVSRAAEAPERVTDPARQAEVYDQAAALCASATAFGEWETAGKLFQSVGGYRDAETRAADCRERAEEARREAVYQQAKSRQGGDAARLYAKAELMRSIAGYRDADQLAADYQRQADALAAKDEAVRQTQEQHKEAEKAQERVRTRHTRRVVGWCVAAGVAVVAVVLLSSLYLWPKHRYNVALEKYNAGDLAAASDIWAEIAPFGDTTARLQDVYYRLGREAEDKKDYRTAADYLDRAGNYEDAPAQLRQVSGVLYDTAKRELDAGQYADAQADFAAAGDYADAKAYKHYCRALRVWNGDDTVDADKLDVKKAKDVLFETLSGTWTNEQTRKTVTFRGAELEEMKAKSGRLEWTQDGVTYEVRVLAADKITLTGDGALAGNYKKN